MMVFTCIKASLKICEHHDAIFTNQLVMPPSTARGSADAHEMNVGGGAVVYLKRRMMTHNFERDGLGWGWRRFFAAEEIAKCDIVGATLHFGVQFP